MAGFTHIYLPRAAQTTDPVERMKNVVACFIGTMTLSSGNFLKPLNPILGETLQVDFSDGSKLYMEQTCHHPPVSSFYLRAPDDSVRCETAHIQVPSLTAYKCTSPQVLHRMNWMNWLNLTRSLSRFFTFYAVVLNSREAHIFSLMSDGTRTFFMACYGR
jgi:hypothetical protein